MSTAPRPRSARCGFGKLCRVPAAPRDFKSVTPRQCRVPRGRSSKDESLQNEETVRRLFSEITTVVFLVYPTAFTCVLAMPFGEDSQVEYCC